MAGSLQDQLIAAGLATKDQAKKAKNEKKAERRAKHNQQKKSAKNKQDAPQSELTLAQKRAAQLKAQKASRDKAVAKIHNEKAQERALRAEIQQLIKQHDQRKKETQEDDQPYNFVHGKKIKKIYVPKAQIEQLSKGTLVIVNNNGFYHLLPKEAADKVAERDPKRIIVAHDKGTTSGNAEDDEYYAQFEVPDDLDW
ncbi:MAG: DUF2058 family protein [Pseudomonadota bacterium]